jgi:hypothetical protein
MTSESTDHPRVGIGIVRSGDPAGVAALIDAGARLDERPDWQVLTSTTFDLPTGEVGLLGCLAAPFDGLMYDPSDYQAIGRFVVSSTGLAPGEISLSIFQGKSRRDRRKLADFVVTDFARRASSDSSIVRLVEHHLGRFPTPTFQSPPKDFQSFGKLLSKGGQLAATGTLAETGHSALAVLTGVGSFVYWFGKPSARVLRRALAERVAMAVDTTLIPEDEE